MYNLSELIKTDCCIDCGTNEKLREVVKKLPIPPTVIQVKTPVRKNETYIWIYSGKYTTDITYDDLKLIPLTSINIDL